MRLISSLLFCSGLFLGCFGAFAQPDPVRIALDAEFGNKTSTADDAIKLGLEVAIDEINRAGGVLGGRPLELLTRDNRGVPARAVDNLKELAAQPDLVALFTSKFSPVVLAQLEPAHRLKVPLLGSWSAADGIIDHEYKPSYSFRLSLRDGWVMPYLLDEARRRGFKKVGLLIPNGAWGRSNQVAAEAYAVRKPMPTIAKITVYDWSDTSLTDEYQGLLEAGAEAVIVVGNEPEVALLVKGMTALPRGRWRPILSHWGAAGGDLLKLTGPVLLETDLAVVQTFSFVDNNSPKARQVLAAALKRLGSESVASIPSPVGVAHAYDLMYLLKHAIEQAKSTDREKIRDALEHLASYDGLIRRYAPPFTPARHEALGPEQLFMAKWRSDGALIRFLP